MMTDQQRAELKALADRFAKDEFYAGTFSEAFLVLLADLEEAEAEIIRLRQGLWDCFAAAGGDTDGDPTPVTLVSDIVPLALGCVRELRADLEEENERLESELAATRQQLAEAQAFIRAGQFFARDYYRNSTTDHEEKSDRLAEWLHANPDTSTLQSAIEQAVAPYKRDAECMDFIEQYRPMFCPGYYGGKWQNDKKLGTLCWDGKMSEGATYREAIYAALSAKEKSNG